MRRRTPAVTAENKDARQICGPATATYAGVVAKAREIWLSGRLYECVIDAAGRGTALPTKHDRDNAAITSLVFGKQPYFRGFQCRYATLHYADCARRQIPVSLAKAEEMLRRATEANRQLSLKLPSPLVGFLCSDRVNRNCVCRKFRSSE